MILASLLSFLPALLAGGDGAATAATSSGVRVMTVEQQVILRVPVRPRPRLRLRWEESEDGPKCLPARAIVGAMFSGRGDSIDFLLKSGRRMRARLDSDCEGLDYYGNFYVQPEDRMVCARRDVIRSRVGGTCRIEKFHLLVPRVERSARIP